MLDYILIGLLLISFVINFFYLGTPLIKKNDHTADKQPSTINMFAQHKTMESPEKQKVSPKKKRQPNGKLDS